MVSVERRTAKTSVACALVGRLRGILPVPPAVVRLVETGCHHDEGHDLLGTDGRRLRAAAGDHVPPLVASPYRFTGRGAPRLAADRAGVGLTRQDLIGALIQAEDFGSMVVVDTEGGLFTAMAEDARLIDLCESTNASVLIVGVDEEGAESSALLAIEACARRNIQVAGVILSQTTPSPGDFENRRLIEAYAGVGARAGAGAGLPETVIYPSVPFIAGERESDEDAIVAGIEAHFAHHQIAEAILATIAPTPEQSEPAPPK